MEDLRAFKYISIILGFLLLLIPRNNNKISLFPLTIHHQSSYLLLQTVRVQVDAQGIITVRHRNSKLPKIYKNLNSYVTQNTHLLHHEDRFGSAIRGNHTKHADTL